MPQIKQRLLNITLVLSLALISLGSVAFAKKSDLILPSEANSNIELTLQNEFSIIEPEKILKVFVGHQDACCTGKSSIGGRYSVTGNTVTFDPAFDFVKGQYYTVETHNNGSENNSFHSLKEFIIQPENEAIRPEVSMIYPSGPTLPENTLRFYIHFSTPMKPHLSSEFIKLIDENGKSDNAAFMKFKQELWSEDRRRLTLLMDPGRIKRYVAQNLTLGPALLEGKSYSIVIEEGWPSANNGIKIPRFEKKFSVTSALRKLPDVKLWKTTPPKISTLDPLIINFDRPFDSQLAKSGIKIFNHQGNLISGKITIEDNEKSWHFHPDQKWENTSIKLTIDARLEDVAGNNFKDLLDHTVGTSIVKVDEIKLLIKLSSRNEN